METYSVVARFKGEGRVLQFTVLSSWESVMGEICARWSLDASEVIVKFVTPDSYKTLCPIESEVDFQRMCHIYQSFNKFVVDIIVEEVRDSADGNSGPLNPS
ncbi:CAD PB1 domains-containing protein [Dioscorea alata]|uniref:CAD PB1 domains-containing protein n=1 Tax=Dioscorea alata TaxID=55571 RepID=A0ACB7VPN6_DIOAL|nr:CAD PB1 domains-containing protein [Dioscorea alata]